MVASVFNYAKDYDIPMTTITFTPHFDEKKGRVVKGDCLAHSGWNKKKIFCKKLVSDINSRAWMIDLKKAGFYVIDIDVKNGKTAKDVLLPIAWKRLNETSDFIVETGSGGLHCYYKIPSCLEEGKLSKRIKASNFQDWFIEEDIADVDILAGDCSIITPGSSYSYDGKLYEYKIIKGKSYEDVDECEFTWKHLHSLIFTSNSELALNKEIKDSPIIEEEIQLHISNIPNIDTNWNTWYRMAQLLFNIGCSFEVFDNWSQLNKNYNSKTTSQLWRGLKRGSGFTIGTLLYLSKEANIIEYERIRSLYKVNKIIINDDKEAGDLLYNELKDSIIYCNCTFYNKFNNVWYSDKDALEHQLRHYVMNSNLYLNGKEPTPYSGRVNNARNAAIVIMDNAIANRNDNFENMLFESSRGKILFNNGYCDMKKGTFHNCDDISFDKSIIFTEKISYDFDISKTNDKNEQSIKKRLFVEPFDDIGEYYLLKIARGLAGDSEKKFIAGIGSSNTGKSALSSALNHTAGGYIGTWNGANMCYKSNSQSDEAQKQRWIYLLRFKRIIISNELTIGGLGLDGNILKKLSNGGLDTLVAREHCSNEKQFKIGFLPILFAQDLDVIKPCDDAVMNRLRAINYKKVYVEEPSNEFELKIDTNFENEIQTLEFRMAFISLLIKTYTTWNKEGRNEEEPECVKIAVKEIVGTDTNIIDAFLNDYEITNNEDDFIKSDDITKWLKISKKLVTLTKFGLEMNKYCKINKFENINSGKFKKIGGKSYRGWTGIRFIEEEIDCPVTTVRY